jgi:hypothetical protein
MMMMMIIIIIIIIIIITTTPWIGWIWLRIGTSGGLL